MGGTSGSGGGSSGARTKKAKKTSVLKPSGRGAKMGARAALLAKAKGGKRKSK